MNTLRRGFTAAAAAARAREGIMQFSSGSGTVAPMPRRKWRRLRSQSWVRMLLMVWMGWSALLEEIGQHERLDQCGQAVVGGFALRGDLRELGAVVEGHRAAEGEHGELLGQRGVELVEIGEHQLLELGRVGKFPSVGQFTAGIDGWVGAGAVVHDFLGAPATDGVV